MAQQWLSLGGGFILEDEDEEWQTLSGGFIVEQPAAPGGPALTVAQIISHFKQNEPNPNRLI